MLKCHNVYSTFAHNLRSSRWFMIKRCMSSTDRIERVMAIRREDINVWERRAPLAPHHCKKLVQHGVKVIVQPSNRRAYPMQEYERSGCTIQEDISEASFIVGVKQVPCDQLMPARTYAFFSHTIKAQIDNMPLLDAILQKSIRLIDYERMVDENGARVVAFGKYAGVSGMINILHGLGLRLLALGHHTPFMHIGPSHNYRNTEMARWAIRDAGYEISLGHLPQSLGPITFIFTGSGNVSQGAQEVFQELPYEYIEPEHLPKVARGGDTNKIYACVVSREDHYVRKEGGTFDAEEFEQFPQRYGSNFSQVIAPYASLIVNGIYWAPNSPRLISIPDAKTLLRPQTTPWIRSSVGCPSLPHRLIAICDISADPGGSIEFMTECTTIDKPFSLYDADENVDTESFAGPGVLICSIDNMPAQIPREATDFFGSLLLPYVYDMVKSEAETPFDDYNVSPVVKNPSVPAPKPQYGVAPFPSTETLGYLLTSNEVMTVQVPPTLVLPASDPSDVIWYRWAHVWIEAVITSNGKLTPRFEYIADLRTQRSAAQRATMSSASSKKSALLLGAGYVSAPVVEYLTRDDQIHVTVASQLQDQLTELQTRFPHCDYSLMDISRCPDDLSKLIKSHDVVVSLLPPPLHAEVAKLCIKHKTNMVTASYISPAMRQLHKQAVDADITIVNEVGIDPGIDHMLAMQCFNDIKEKGGKIVSYESWCGGLPAPEASDNPLLYKFSWFPKGVLNNLLSSAKYLENGEIVEIQSGELPATTRDLTFLPGFNIEGFANRDSTIYIEPYGIESANTVLRGTIRYKGFASVGRALIDLGLLDDEPRANLHPNAAEITWKQLMCDLVGKKQDILIDSLIDLVYEKVGCDDVRLKAIQDLGLLDDRVVEKKDTVLNTLSAYLAKTLAFDAGERDLIIMRHDIGCQMFDGSREMHHVSLVVYGEPHGYTAMAKTVGYPTAIATKMVLEGEIQNKGLTLPLTIDMYRPILSRLKQEGIVSRETVTSM